MIIKPKTWGFLCTSAHPLGCAANVRDQIDATRALGTRDDGPGHVLVIGASTGYGLAARIVAAFGFGAATIGVFAEKPARRQRTASAGWYNAAAFQACADAAGLQSLSINGDAFSDAVRERTIESIRQELDGRIDLVIYSLAAPARRLPDSGTVVHSAIKPIGAEFVGTSIDTDNDRIVDVTVEPATHAEIDDTIKVMGGDDWGLWLDALAAAGVLAERAATVAFSYIGPQLTWPIYAHGTIGRAKRHLEASAAAIEARHARHGLEARVAVMQSLVTQASAAIPSIPLYLSLAYRVMKDKGLHENAIDQQNRLFRDFLYPRGGGEIPADNRNRWRLDEHELRAGVQSACSALWPLVHDDTLFALTDYAGYKQAFLQLFGFARPDIDYAADVDPEVSFTPHSS